MPILSRHTLFVIAVFATAATSCSNPPKPTLEPAAGLGLGPECRAARVRAARGGAVRGRVPPAIAEMFAPPTPVPAAARGRVARISLRVDSAGTPVPTSIRVEGISDKPYADKLKALVVKSRYRPAALDGCGVQSQVRFTLNIPK
ncbi:MAG TPA: hypothetical protein VE869_05775 [Gemmatimonas sp.]|nr:hypothetical protein [Gemmatimonas sp.]